METKTINEPKVGEFFQLRPDARRGGKATAWSSRTKALLSPPRLILKPDEGGFPPLHETPRLVYNPSEGELPQDLEGGFSGYWLVSNGSAK